MSEIIQNDIMKNGIMLIDIILNAIMPNDIKASNIYFNIIMVNYIMAKNKMLYDITESNTELHNADCHHANIIYAEQGILKGEYHCTIDLLFDWFGINCMTTDNFGFYLQNRLIQTSREEVKGTVILPPLVFPVLNLLLWLM